MWGGWWGAYVVDVGTGSGALGITANLEFPDIKVIVTDIDAKCLKIARQNAKKHEVNITFLQGNLLEPLLHNQPGFTHGEPGNAFSLSSEIKCMNDTLHEQRKGKIFTGHRPTADCQALLVEQEEIGDTWILFANLPTYQTLTLSTRLPCMNPNTPFLEG